MKVGGANCSIFNTKVNNYKILNKFKFNNKTNRKGVYGKL